MLGPANIASFLCALLVSINPAAALPKFCEERSPQPGNSDLRTFTYIPSVSPGFGIPTATPLQFNGSYPGQGDMPGQLGWWNSPPYEGNTPVDLVSFVQFNAQEGIVFWAERTAFELYLSPVAEKTYAVKLGNPEMETPAGVAGQWTVAPIAGNEYGFGWQGDYESWFTCYDAATGFVGLYFGDVLANCGSHFVLKAKYDS